MMIKLNITTESLEVPDKDGYRMIELTVDGFEIEGLDELTPLPWDAVFNIANDKLVLMGGAGPGGHGSCTVEIPLSSANRLYSITAYPVGDTAELTTLLRRYNLL